MSKAKPITMESDTFEKMKHDITVSLNKLLNKMRVYKSEKGTLTVKMTISLNEAELDSGNEGTVPTFEHKVTSTVQIKDETTGKLDGEYVLEDDGHGGHVLKPLSQQMEMFEEPV